MGKIVVGLGSISAVLGSLSVARATIVHHRTINYWHLRNPEKIAGTAERVIHRSRIWTVIKSYIQEQISNFRNQKTNLGFSIVLAPDLISFISLCNIQNSLIFYFVPQRR